VFNTYTSTGCSGKRQFCLAVVHKTIQAGDRIYLFRPFEQQRLVDFVLPSLEPVSTVIYCYAADGSCVTVKILIIMFIQ